MIGEYAGVPKHKKITFRVRYMQDVVMGTGCEKQRTISVLPPKRMSAGWQI
jgi:hypothetical protein